MSILASMGIQALAGTLNSIGEGQGVGQSVLENAPIVGGLFKGKREQKEQAHADKAIDNANMNFAAYQGSNIPMANGGKMNNPVPDGNNLFASFDVGGTHEENPNGGIPIGMNTVEEGESKFKFDDGNYVFSDRLKY